MVALAAAALLGPRGVPGAVPRQPHSLARVAYCWRPASLLHSPTEGAPQKTNIHITNPTPSLPRCPSLLSPACDVMEDVAIAYGYNNLVKRVPATVTAGRELPLNQLTELLRAECAMAGAAAAVGAAAGRYLARGCAGVLGWLASACAMCQRARTTRV